MAFLGCRSDESGPAQDAAARPTEGAPASESPGDSRFRFGDAAAKNDQGETLVLHADGAFEYRVEDGEIRGRLFDGKIVDANGRTVATYAADGAIVSADPKWAIAQRIGPDGTFYMHDAPHWMFDANGDTVEKSTGQVVLRTSTVPSDLRNGMMLAHVALSLLLLDRQLQGAKPPPR